MKIALIAAIDLQNGIGKDNKLLCHISSDLKRFKQLTTGHTILMGRKTFESLPDGALPNRKNVVVSQNKNYQANSCTIVHSIDEALKLCKSEEKIFVIGGGQIYAELFPLADILHVTKIHHHFLADTFFPEIKPEEWVPINEPENYIDPKTNLKYSFIDYIRRAVNKGKKNS
jgi:dihydrofolate reductase